MNQLTPTTKVFYVNGMTTSYADALATANEIQQMSLAPVELVHNDTTSSDVTGEMAAKVALGLLGFVFVYNMGKKTPEEKTIVTAAGLASASVIGSAIKDYSEIQSRKETKAKELLDRVWLFLSENPLNEATLVLHSQGAHIGEKALERLSIYKDRIKVVTIGGAVNIPSALAGRVVNFTHVQDYISSVAKFVYTKEPRSTYLTTSSCETTFCHGTTDYLKPPIVRNTITALSAPSWVFHS